METKLTPGFIVAAPGLKDPFFKQSVVFLVEHDNNEGSFGLMVNRGMSVTLGEVLDELEIGRGDPAKPFQTQVLDGGPVTPHMGWMIHSTDWVCEDSSVYGKQVAVTANKSVMEAVAVGRGPSRYQFCLGYAGWGREQLTDEIKAGAWLHVPFFEELLFEVPLAERWRRAVARLGFDPAYLCSTMGGA